MSLSFAKVTVAGGRQRYFVLRAQSRGALRCWSLAWTADQVTRR